MFLGFRTKEEKRLDAILDEVMVKELRTEANKKLEDSQSLERLFRAGRNYIECYEKEHRVHIESADKGDKTLLYMFNYSRTLYVKMEIDPLGLTQVDSLKHDLDMLLWMLRQ